MTKLFKIQFSLTKGVIHVDLEDEGRVWFESLLRRYVRWQRGEAE